MGKKIRRGRKRGEGRTKAKELIKERWSNEES